MPKRRTPKTAEAKLVSDAMYDQGVAVVEIAKMLKLETDNFASQMITGERPIPTRYAEALGARLGLDPEAISIPYRQARAAITGSDTGDERSPGLIVSRVENDLDAINFALGAIVSVMVRHRPAEAEELAKILKKTPSKFRDSGLLAALGKTLGYEAQKAKVRGVS